MSNENEQLQDESATEESVQETPTEENVAFTEDDASTLATEPDADKLRAEVAELKDSLLRSQAELENFRRRTHKESLDAMKYQDLSMIRDILPGIDNLKRAVDAAEQSGDTQQLVDGIKMVSQQFMDALKSHSAVQIDPEGQPFDPNLHEALTQVPSADHEPMTVLQVIEVGYQLHDRVIRPAKVMVSCAPPATSSDEATNEATDN